MNCPAGGLAVGDGICPMSGVSRNGPRGCAFIGYTLDGQQSLYGVPQGPNAPAIVYERERKTISELLLPEAPSSEKTKLMANADSLNPLETDVLAMALGAPARRVLQRADALGPRTGWRDGYLSTRHGFCPPDPSTSPIALAASPGRVWSDLCARLPGLVSRGKCREAISGLPLVAGTPDVIPDAALWAAVVCLGILASTWRYEERNDGHEGLVMSAAKSAFLNVAGDEDEEPETRGIPRVVVIPLRQICTRLGRPLPYLSQSDASIYNFKLRDHTSIVPYPERIENMDLRWPVFQDRGEAMFLLCMADSHGCFTPAVDLIATCQERVMERDNEGLLDALIKLKGVVDQLPYVFHKISVNPGSGENFAHPVEWGQRYAKWSAPLSARVPALSGLFLPLFQTMDAFLGRTNFRSFLGVESIHLRAWMPLNIRAFLAAIEHSYSVPEYIRSSGDPRLMGVLDGIVEGYAGERGFMGTHRYKVYGFLEVVAKTGRIETNGNSGAADTHGRPWQEVHRTLAASMLERLEPFRRGIPVATGATSTSIASDKQTVIPWMSASPHEWRGTFEECRFRARVVARNSIDDDESRSTGRVTIDLRDSGLNFAPGDRLAIMPLNAWKIVEKVIGALGLMDALDEFVPLTAPGTETWRAYAKHEAEVLRSGTITRFTVRDILRKGKLAPLTKPMVLAVHTLLRAPTVTLRILASSEWPVQGSLGDLLIAAVNEVPEDVWNRAFDLRDLSWLPALMPLEVPRTYSVSKFSGHGLPDSVDLTVSRVEHRVCQQLVATGAEDTIPGVASGFLNPNPLDDYYIPHAKLTPTPDIDDVLIGISRPLNFQLPISAGTPIAMFAGGSGIAPFRSFWQARIASGAIGRNVLFLGVQSRKKFLYKQELRQYVLAGQLELHIAFSRDSNGLVFDPQLRDLVEKQIEPRYIDATIVDQGSYICDLVTSTKLGGLGGSLYICGSLALYETVMSGLRQALYKYRAVTRESADKLLATAFAERRFMLDVFMTPRIISDNEPTISLSALAQYTGHRDGKMWIGVHGSVYDVTEFLPIHPGGSLIVAASAGLDASVTFNEVAHTSNPEVMSLLGKYFIGRLQPTPSFQLQDLNELRAGWVGYLRTCVEGLTTMSFETKSILQDSRIWFQGGLLNIGGVRKFYQFQSRLIQNGFPNLFGTKIHELYFKLTFVLASGVGGDLPDVMGTITRAHSSLASITARKTVAEIGEFVGNGSTAQAFENGIIAYAQAAIELDTQLLERVRDEVCLGLDAFDRVAEIIKSYPGREKQALYKIASVLIKYLERVAERLESYYADHAALSLYNPNQEANPARARWNILHRRIRDGSFFVFTRQIHFTDDLDDVQTVQPASKTRVARNKRETVTFDQILSQAVSSIVASEKREKIQLETPQLAGQNQGLAAVHTQRAGETPNASSTYEEQSVQSASKRMSKFMQSRLKDIRRLSHTKSTFSLKHAFAAYGVNSAPSHSADSDSGAGATSTNVDREQSLVPRPHDIQPLRLGSLPLILPLHLPNQKSVVPSGTPTRPSSVNSNRASPIEPPPNRAPRTRSVRPGSIAEPQRKYTISLAPLIDAGRVHRSDSFMKPLGGSTSSDASSVANPPSAGHW